MRNILSSGLTQLVVALLVLGLLFKLTQAAIPPFQALPVNGIENNRLLLNSAPGNDLKNLYPLVANQAEKNQLQKVSGVISVDEAFSPKINLPEASHSIKSSSPDYFVLLKSNNVLQLQAVTNNGAILNQRFYAYDSGISDFSYPGISGKMVTPVLQRSSEDGAVQIAENPGKRQFTLTLK